MHLAKNLTLPIIISLIVSCSRQNDTPDPPPPPPPQPAGVNYQLLNGWWKVSPGNNAAITKLYFANDKFHFEHYGSTFGNRVGSWAQLPNDSLKLSITGGFSAPETRDFKISKLTATELEIIQGVFKAVYNKLDSPLIVSKPISTIAGTGINGFAGDGGLATAAQLQNGILPFCIDAADNIYMLDGNRIRKINALTGIITTIAGTGTPGNTGNGAPAINANIEGWSIAVDAGGNLYIGDYNNRCIRKINAADGIINRFAGTTVWGFSGDGGPAINADLRGPQSLCFDAMGNLYFSDNNIRIRKIAAGTGIITTVAGNGVYGASGDGGPALAAQISASAIAVDGSGNIYLGGQNFYFIRKINASNGIINTIAGTGVQGYNGEGIPATTAQISNHVASLRVDAAGNVYFVEYINPRIRKIATDGKVYTVAGTGHSAYIGDGPHATAYDLDLSVLSAIVLDSQGNIFISTTARIRKIIQ